MCIKIFSISSAFGRFNGSESKILLIKCTINCGTLTVNIKSWSKSFTNFYCKKFCHGLSLYSSRSLKRTNYTKAADIYDSFGLHNPISFITVLYLDFDYLQDAILGLKCIHEKELFHRDLHIAESQAQIKEADINNDSLNNSIPSTSLGLSYKTRSEAIYTSVVGYSS
ncbi:kinase-like domain-containing protein [Rhizophagus irregularis DAOM 181602=DAOM 197198]|nr:kinase-like domain-containing protein [Rhizophagus irregularis DAOM 181602=DAOM 197198]